MSRFDLFYKDDLLGSATLPLLPFLLDQRQARKMYIAALDMELARQQERVCQRQHEEEERRQRAIGQMTVSTSLATEFQLMDEVDSAQSQSCSDSDEDFKPAVQKTPSQNVGKQFNSQTTSQLFTPHVTNALDRNKTSDHVALRLMVPIASALGCDPSSMPLSRSTIHRARKKQGKNMLKQSGLNL